MPDGSVPVVMLQTTLPAESGAKRTVTSHASPEPSAKEPVPETTVKTGQEARILPASVPPPPFCNVKESSAASPSSTSPKSRLSGSSWTTGRSETESSPQPTPIEATMRRIGSQGSRT